MKQSLRDGAYVVPVLLFLAALAFPLGLVLPLMRIDSLWLFEHTPSLVQVVTGLYAGGDTILAAIVAVFSILFPGAKLLVLFVAAFSTGPGRGARALSALGKWSMMDVMLVALIVFAAKTSGLASAQTLPGLWFFAAAALFSALAALAIEQRRRRAARGGPAAR